MFHGGIFMVISASKYYGYRLKKEIMEHDDFDSVNKPFFKAFCNTINTFPTEIDENIFLDYIEYNFDLIDKACFYYLVYHLGNYILTKDPFYVSELCTALTLKDISYQAYIPIAKYLLEEPLYSLIIKLNDSSHEMGFVTIFAFIINKFKGPILTETNHHRILKLLDSNHKNLFNSIKSLNDILLLLHKKMREINNKELIFTSDDFNKLKLLEQYNQSENDTLKEQLLQELIAGENTNFSAKDLIKHCLKIISKYQCQFSCLSLVRGVPNDKK